MADALHDGFQGHVHFCQHTDVGMPENVRAYFFAWNHHLTKLGIDELNIIGRARPGREDIASILVCTANAIRARPPQFHALIIFLEPL